MTEMTGVSPLVLCEQALSPSCIPHSISGGVNLGSL